MKMRTLSKRICSVILAALFLVNSASVSFAVQDWIDEDETSKIVREIAELREESVKHFLCEDGSYIAATYSTPVHYKENGEWKEIDNSLFLNRKSLSVSGKPTYTPKASGLSVSIPQSFSDGQKITAENKGYEISFGLKADQKNVSLKKSASVVGVDALASNAEIAKNAVVQDINNYVTTGKVDENDSIEAHNEEIMSVDNQSGAVAYKDVFPNTDLEYIVSTNCIKESIVVYESQSEYEYSFEMNFDGLTPITYEDGSICLVEADNPDDYVFWIEAPYMFDANNQESFDIEMSLEETEEQYVLTLVANAEWVNSEERAFPVVIDPTIYLADSSISDVFVIDGLGANSPKVNEELRVGRNLTNVTRTYIKPTMPTTVPFGSKISYAYLKLYKDYYYQAPLANDISIRVYDCCNVATWKSHEVSWNNQPFGTSNNGYASTEGAEYLCSMPASDSTGSYSFPITAAVQRWVNNGVNNGLMLASSNETQKTQIDFHSTRASSSNKHPDLWFNYEIPHVDQQIWNVGKHAATSSKITVTAGKTWTVTSNQPWLTVSNKTENDFEIVVAENPDESDREGVLTVKIDNTIIGTINVTQSGIDPSLLIDKDTLVVNPEGDNEEIVITSNCGWTVECDAAWLSVSSVAGNGNGSITIAVAENDSCETRSGTVTFSTVNEFENIEKAISITQLDNINAFFGEVNSDGLLENKSSSVYNHALATWAMELSYAAYNYPDGSELPDIPGKFMGDVTQSAIDVLNGYGFEAVEDYCYGPSDSGAHVIAHRYIAAANAENAVNVNTGGENSNVYSGFFGNGA